METIKRIFRDITYAMGLTIWMLFVMIITGWLSGLVQITFH